MRQPGTAINMAICVPAQFQVEALFAYDLAQMMAFTASVIPDYCSVGLHMNIDTYAHTSRTELMQDALKADATHLLWLEPSMRFPRDTAVRLLQREVPFVGVNYTTRVLPPTFTALKDGKPVSTTDTSTGLEEVDVIGFGAFMMEADTLVNLTDPDYDPWFWFAKDEDGTETSEHAYFCRKIVQEHLNERIFVDHELSRECSHVGGFEFKLYHAETADEVKIEALEVLKETTR